MPQKERYDLIFKALGNSRRREILDLLKARSRTTAELVEHFKHLDRCTVMQHLCAPEKADLVAVKPDVRLRSNYINPLPIRELHDCWIVGYPHNAVDLLARMQRDLGAD